MGNLNYTEEIMPEYHLATNATLTTLEMYPGISGKIPVANSQSYNVRDKPNVYIIWSSDLHYS
jgi:hypothetical protein